MPTIIPCKVRQTNNAKILGIRITFYMTKAKIHKMKVSFLEFINKIPSGEQRNEVY